MSQAVSRTENIHKIFKLASRYDIFEWKVQHWFDIVIKGEVVVFN